MECKKNGIPSAGLEANPVVQFFAQTKVAWDIDPDKLVKHAKDIAKEVEAQLEKEGIEDDPIFKPFVNDKETNLKPLRPPIRIAAHQKLHKPETTP